MRAFGPKFLLEVVFLAAVAVVTVAAGLEWPAIVLVLALAYLLVVVFDISISRARARQQTDERPAEPSPPACDRAPARPRDPARARLGEPAGARAAARARPGARAGTAAGARAAAAGAEAELLPDRRSRAASSSPCRTPNRSRSRSRERVVALPVAASPREWNVWELERLARAHSGGDAVQDEERAYLLVYLREFATPEGTLPVDFDTLVRESFGELLVPGR